MASSAHTITARANDTPNAAQGGPQREIVGTTNRFDSLRAARPLRTAAGQGWW